MINLAASLQRDLSLTIAQTLILWYISNRLDIPPEGSIRYRELKKENPWIGLKLAIFRWNF